MFYIWAEFTTAPGGIDDAGSTLFSSDATEADFADYAKSRGFTEVRDYRENAGYINYWNPDSRSYLVNLGTEGDSAGALRIAGYIKFAGRILG